MALSTFSLTLTLSILSIWAAVDSAHYQPAAPSPSSSSSPTEDCSSLILNIADCLSFVSSGSQVPTPEVTCCSGLKTVIQTDGDCLCEAFKSSASLGVTLNLTRASTLPALCTIPASSVPKCALSLVPAGAPGVQPSTTADAPTTGAGGASEAAPAPAPAPGKSGSPVLSVSTGSLVVGLLIIMLV